MSDDSKRESNVIKGNFRDPDPPVSSPFALNLYEEVEYREDGPWLVVYAFGKKMGEVPIKPGTEPRIKRAKVLKFPSQRNEDDSSGDDSERGE